MLTVSTARVLIMRWVLFGAPRADRHPGSQSRFELGDATGATCHERRQPPDVDPDVHTFAFTSVPNLQSAPARRIGRIRPIAAFPVFAIRERPLRLSNGRNTLVNVA